MYILQINGNNNIKQNIIISFIDHYFMLQLCLSEVKNKPKLCTNQNPDISRHQLKRKVLPIVFTKYDINHAKRYQ